MDAFTKEISWTFEIYFLLKVVLAFIAGGAIGLEREQVGKAAGIRTFGFICAGACSYAVLSELFSPDTATRIVANIVVGIGFIAGGVFYRSDNTTRGLQGLTTASSLWVTATVGIMIGFGMYILAFGVTVLSVLALHLPSSNLWKYLSKKQIK